MIYVFFNCLYLFLKTWIKPVKRFTMKYDHYLDKTGEPIEVDRFREAPLERGQVTNISESGAWTISSWIKNPMYTYSTFSWSSEKVRKTSLNCGGFKN